MKNKKNVMKLSVLIAALLLGIMLIGGTLSYLAGVTPSRTNTFTIGSVVTELFEPEFKVEGTKISKNPYVTNVGDVDCIVRMKIEISPEEIVVPLSENPSYINSAGMNAEMTSEEVSGLWNLGYRFWLNYNTNATQKASWVYNSTDGYWYYQDVLSPAEDSSELFTEVKWLIIENGTWKEIQDFDIYIKKEATYAVYYDKSGAQHSSLSNDTYNQEKAMDVWNAMQVAGKIF